MLDTIIEDDATYVPFYIMVKHEEPSLLKHDKIQLFIGLWIEENERKSKN